MKSISTIAFATALLAFGSVASAQQRLTAEEILATLQNNASPQSLSADEIVANLQNSFRVSEESPTVLLPTTETSSLVQGLPTIDIEIFFDYNSATIKAESLRDLGELGKALTSPSLAGKSFVVAGHTDAVGSNTYNAKLSRMRAEAIRDFLVRAFPLEPSRLVPMGFGEEQLRDPSNPDAAINRRVQIVNIGA